MSTDKKNDGSKASDATLGGVAKGSTIDKVASTPEPTKGSSADHPAGGLSALYREVPVTTSAPPDTGTRPTALGTVLPSPSQVETLPAERVALGTSAENVVPRVEQPRTLGTKIPAPKPRAARTRPARTLTTKAAPQGPLPPAAEAILLMPSPRPVPERASVGSTTPSASDRSRGVVAMHRRPPLTEEEARQLVDRTLATLDPGVPLVLLPVRIETRFRDQELLVRIFPDEIFADAHEPLLTEDEHRAGIRYWHEAQRGHESDAWERLVQSYTAPRATWIRDVTTRCTDTDACPRRPASWTRAVEARLLPERWAVTLDPPVNGRSLFVGHAIHSPLALSMKPPGESTPSWDERDAPLPIDDELQWTIDFDRAIDVGMALRIPLGPGVDHLDRVTVFGVRASRDATTTSEELTGLLTAHRYTGGLALVPQGTRTNNSEQGTSGYSAGRRDSKRITSSSSDGGAPYHEESLAAAFGVGDDVFANLEGTGLHEYTNAGDMNLLLWPATLGYYLARRAEPLVSVPMWDQIRTHFTQWVRGRGPLPCFRVGRVPYSVLPVSSLSGWTGSDGNEFDKQIPPLLRAAREVWRPAIAGVPRIVPGSSDPDRDLLEVLGMDASAREVRVRYGIGPQTLLNVSALAGLPPEMVNRWCETSTGRGDPRLRERGLRGGLATTVYDDRAPRDVAPFICAGPLSETSPLPRANNYFETLATISAESLQALDVQDAPLLLVLLRHALLLEFVRIAWELRVAGGAEMLGDDRRDALLAIRTGARQREPEIVGASNDLESAPWDAIANAGALSGFFRLDLENVPDTAAGRYVRSELADYKRALRRLARCPTAELERVFSETLDLCSHRLDAWITSLSTHRLAQMRETTPRGCHVGAYAWVENLRRRTEGVPSEGYIHAPSMDHAATAAVLRNAFATHRDGSARFAIDLSSRRVRLAQGILDEVRAGRSLGEVLGAQVERAIHDGHQDRYIDRLRNAYPLVANKMREAHEEPDLVAGRSVVDGLALHRDFERALETVIDEADRPFFRALGEVLASSVDAVSDLLTAESVYQLIRGNPAVAGVNLDAVAKGARPPDPEVVRTPRSGTSLTHRVALLWSPERPRRSDRPTSMRALLEPTLDAWVGRMLGDLSTVECTVLTVPSSSPGGSTESRYRVPLSVLHLSPLEILAMAHIAPVDWVRASPEGAPAGTPPPPPAEEVGRRIIDYVEGRVPSVRVTRILYQEHVSDRSFATLWEIARTLNDVLLHARPLRGDDLRISNLVGTPSDPPLLDTIFDDAVTLVKNFADVCAKLVMPSATLASLRTNLESATRFGLAEAYPAPASLAASEAETRTLAQTTFASMLRRLARAANKPVPATTPATAELLVLGLQEEAVNRLRGAWGDVLEALFGSRPLLLTPFLPQEPDRIRSAFAARGELGADAPSVKRWLFGVSRVRPALSRWQKLSLYLSAAPAPGAAGPTPPLGLEILQLSPTPYPRWVALPFVEATTHTDEILERPPSGTLSLAIHAVGGIPSGLWAGLVVDQWVELIPNRRELTGIAFHHDDPGAEAPQTVLLAVPPAAGTPWSVESLQNVLDETLELAKIRTVDAERLGVLGQFLPTIHLASNTAERDTVSTNFSGRLVEDAPVPGGH